MDDKPFVVMLNPKTLRLVSGRTSNGREYQLDFFGDDDDIGEAYVESSDRYFNGLRLLRVHSPSGIHRSLRGQGYGFLLYSAVAVGVNARSSRVKGVYSVEGSRSDDADLLWQSMVKKKLAYQVTEMVACEGDAYHESNDDCENREETENHCESVRNSHTDDGGEIQDDEVCADVTVVYKQDEREANIDILEATDVVEQDFVLWTAADGASPSVPIDLITRVRVNSRDQAHALARLIRDQYDREVLLAFVDRPDVAELLGQQALFGARPRVALPPMSKRTRRLLDMFDDAP